MGANVALLSYLSGQVHRPLPGVVDPSSLVWVTPLRSSAASPRGPSSARIPMTFTLSTLAMFKQRQTSFTEVAAGAIRSVTLGSVAGPTQDSAMFATPEFFTLLGVAVDRPGLPGGRGITPATCAWCVGVVSRNFARTRLSAPGNGVGSFLQVNGIPIQVVGLIDGGFPGGNLWIPLESAKSVLRDSGLVSGEQSVDQLRVLARLRPGETLESAERDASFAASGIVDSAAGATLAGVRLLPLTPSKEWLARVEAPLAIVTTMILVIACATAAVLLLGRAAARRREFALCFSLGATRTRIVRQMLLEAALLAVAAGIVALLVVWAIDRWLSWRLGIAPVDLAPDRWSVGASLCLAVITGLGAGVVPAALAARPSGGAGLRGLVDAAAQLRGLQRAVVFAEASVVAILAVGAGIATSTFRTALGPPAGVEISHRILMTKLALSEARYTSAQHDSLVRAMTRAVQSIAGVRTVATTNFGPLGEYFHLRGSGTVLLGRAATRGDSADRPARVSVVSPGYFDAAGTPIVHGRAISSADSSGAPRAAVIDEGLIGAGPIGPRPLGTTVMLRRLQFVNGQPEFDTLQVVIVGIAMAAQGLDPVNRRLPEIYLARDQMPALSDELLVVRAAQADAGLESAVRAAISGLAGAMPYDPVRTSADVVGETYARAYEMTVVLDAASLLALCLACVGIYTTIRSSATSRTKETGIRLALGAPARSIVLRFVFDGVLPAACGVCIGAPAGIIMGRYAMVRFGWPSGLDPSALVAPIVTLLLAAVCASLLPAWHASRAHPSALLRAD